jgi:hypothetical protein
MGRTRALAATMNSGGSLMDIRWTRRQFLNGVAGTAAALGVPRFGHGSMGNERSPSPFHGRFLTHVSLVRVNQIEVTPERSIGVDEPMKNSPDRVRAHREAFARGWPGGRMTWALSWLALNDSRQEYKDVRHLLATYHDQYGDEITFVPGGYFAPMYDTREHNRNTIHKALQLISNMVGDNYRPQCVVAGFLDSDNQRHLAVEEGIHVCQGQIWSQFGVDYGDGDGGICYPYYPSTEHYLKPAQGAGDFIDCVCLDGWTCDFLAARFDGGSGHNSRMGLGPIETVGRLGQTVGREELFDTTSIHFDRGYSLNGFAFVTAIWEVVVGLEDNLTWWLQAVRERWPDTKISTAGEFGLEWRSHYRDNSLVDYRFEEQGTGAPQSDKNLEIRWFMNQKFRLALLRDWTISGPFMAIDFTRYDLPAHEPQGLQRDWSLMNVMNQKGSRPQDKPVRFGGLGPDDQMLIYSRYPELRDLAE